LLNKDSYFKDLKILEGSLQCISGKNLSGDRIVFDKCKLSRDAEVYAIKGYKPNYICIIIFQTGRIYLINLRLK